VFPEWGDRLKDPNVYAYIAPLRIEPLLSRRYKRVWVVLYQTAWTFTAPVSEELKARLTAQYADVKQTKHGDVTLLLYWDERSEYRRRAAYTNGIPVK
jgi:hypothetical protein